MRWEEGRDDRTGKYTHSLDKVCECGRTKGQHDGMSPYPCYEIDGLPECHKFKAVKKTKK